MGDIRIALAETLEIRYREATDLKHEVEVLHQRVRGTLSNYME